MPEQSIRFTVSNDAGLRSASWKCWTPPGKEDVYLACRELNGALKASLHASGSWHFAYDQGFFEGAIRPEHRTDNGRFLDRWTAPQPIFPGVVLPLRIVTPYSSVATVHTASPDVHEVPQPADGRAIEFAMLISESSTTVKANKSLVGSYKLPSGRTVWIVHRDVPAPKLPQQKIDMKYFEGASLDDLTGEGLRMAIFSDEPDGSKTIYDYRVLRRPSVEWEVS